MAQVDCSKCDAWCCKQFVFQASDELPPDVKRYFVLHGCAIRGRNIIVPLRCKHLGQDNRCLIYTTRPKFCVDFTCQHHMHLKL